MRRLLRRIKLAGYSLLLSWLVNTLGEWVCRLLWATGGKAPGLALMTAPVYGLTYVMFVVPLVSCCRAALQLRFWYVLLLGSVVWALAACGLIFHASVREMLGPWPSAALPLWFAECAALSMTIYLALLRAATRRARTGEHWSGSGGTERERLGA